VDRNHQVAFKRIGNDAKDIHFHHNWILVNLSKIIGTPEKAMKEISSFKKNYTNILWRATVTNNEATCWTNDQRL
jgi:hypothetical protein